MQSKASLCVAALAATSIVLLVVEKNARVDTRKIDKPRVALVGNPAKFSALYEAWKAQRERAGDTESLTVGLNWSKALSSNWTGSRGSARFDLHDQSLVLDVQGMTQGSAYDAWLVDNAPTSSAAPDAKDKTAFLGTLDGADGCAQLHVDLTQRGLEHFDVDLVVLSKHGLRPDEDVQLVGMPNVFQRLENRERRAREDALAGGQTGFVLGVVAMVAPVPAPLVFDDLIAEGEEIFFFKQFEGNGRTCGTCHPAENNFTIEPAFIATLPPTDPLFVAEFIPDLNFDLNGGLRFENPILMRQFGVIAENLDGFDDLRYRFTMRSVPHTLGMSQTILSPDGPGVVPVERTGWSGDGAPGHGSLREFALGAVKQHFTKTMNRIENIDFVFPSDHQLDALEAFQLSLGRQAELDLSTLVLLDAGAAAGLTAFNSIGCERCHENAGANRGGFNFNFATGVDAFMRHHPDGTGELRPADGGLGTNGAGNNNTIDPTPEPDDPSVLSFGNKTFNTQSLVEFADTVPGFHNNITNAGGLEDSVEGAIKFYSSTEFQTSPDGFVIPFGPNDLQNIGKFLRVINALENVRSADLYGKRAASLIGAGGYDPAAVERLLTLAQADCQDGIDVLKAVGLHVPAQHGFGKAIVLFEEAKSGPDADRLLAIDEARNGKLEFARTQMQG